MTTPTGTIKASDIVDEFGYSRANNSVSLGDYRVNRTVSGLSNLPLDTGVPQSGAISFDSLRGKKLNVVVDCTPTPSNTLLHSYNRYVRTLTDGTPQHFYTSTPNQEDLTGYTLEASNYFSSYVQQISGTVPLYRIFNTETGAHILTTSIDEWNLGPPWIKEEQQSPRSNLLEPIRYQIGQWGYVHPSAVANSEPIRRANRSPYDWLLTTSEVEAQNQGGIGYTYDGIQFHTPKPVGIDAVRVIARTKYDTGQGVTVIGGFKTKPSNPTDKKVWIHTNGTITSDGNSPIVTTTVKENFYTRRDGTFSNYITLTPPTGSGGSTLTFGPDYKDDAIQVLVDVPYTISGSSGEGNGQLRIRLDSSSQIGGDDSGSNFDGDYNDLTLSIANGSFYYTSGGVLSYIFVGKKERVREYCSLLTGDWDKSNDLIVDIGPSARIYGAGGDGGDGGKQAAVGRDGVSGTSAIGIKATNSTTIRVASGAIVSGGGGGGGGGGGAQGVGYNKGKGFVTRGGGGGGGGGQGYPGGANGDGGAADPPRTREPGNEAYNPGTAGGAGNNTQGGNGGNGGSATLGSRTQAFGGGGGGGGFCLGSPGKGGTGVNGGSAGTILKGGDGSKGSQASSNGQYGSIGEGGKGGLNGYGIIVDTAKTNITYSNNGSVSSEVYSTDPS
jgi:hypothetical protein